MATLKRIRVTWDGVKGLPAVSTFYTRSDEGPNLTALSQIFNAAKASVPSGVTWQIQGQGDVIEDTDGSLVGSWGGPTPPAIVATGGNSWAGPVGAVINWKTLGIANGRRMRGRTFLVPLSNGAFTGQGTIGAGTLTPLQTGVTAFVTASAGTFVLWSRPGPKGPGSSHPISEGAVPPLAAVLRSRRD